MVENEAGRPILGGNRRSASDVLGDRVLALEHDDELRRDREGEALPFAEVLRLALQSQAR